MVHCDLWRIAPEARFSFLFLGPPCGFPRIENAGVSVFLSRQLALDGGRPEKVKRIIGILRLRGPTPLRTAFRLFMASPFLKVVNPFPIVSNIMR